MALAEDVRQRFLDTTAMPNAHQRGIENLFDLQRPWHSLVCGNSEVDHVVDGGPDGPDEPHELHPSLPERAFNVLAKLSKDSAFSNKRDRYISNKLPDFVEKMVERQTANLKDQVILEKEIKHTLPKGVRGAMVTFERF